MLDRTLTVRVSRIRRLTPDVSAFEFVHPSVPAALIPLALKVEALLSGRSCVTSAARCSSRRGKPAAGARAERQPAAEQHRAALE